MTEDYRAINRANWDERAPAHAASSDYSVEQFVTDPSFLSQVVPSTCPASATSPASGRAPAVPHRHRHDLAVPARRHDDRAGLLARLARRGPPAGRAGGRRRRLRRVRRRTTPSTPSVRASFDLVFTGIGALCWLPDVRRWAHTVADLLRPGGRLFLREGHPMLWALDEERTDVLAVGYPYFEVPDALVFDEWRHLRRDRRRLREQPRALVEPRPRRDRDEPARRGDGAHRARGARLGPVGRVARAR